MPLVRFKVEDVLSLPFTAKDTSTIFGKNLKLGFNYSPYHIPDYEIKKGLESVLWSPGFRGHRLLEILCGSECRLCDIQDITDMFELVLMPIAGCLGLAVSHRPILRVENSPLFPGERKLAAILRPAFTMRDKQDNVVCVVSITEPCLFHEKSRNSPKEDHLHQIGMDNVIKQLETYMAATASRFGIVFDGYFLILVEFKDDQLKYQNSYARIFLNGRREVGLRGGKFAASIRARVLNLHSAGPSFLEGLIYFLNAAKQAKSQFSYCHIFDYFHLGLKITDRPIEEPPVADGLRKFLNWRTGAELLHRSDWTAATVYKIKAKHLKDVILEPVEDEEFVVVKMYDPSVTERKDPDSLKRIQDRYLSEKQAAEKLQVIKEFNSMYLQHEELEIEFFEGFGKSMIGKAFIMRYIKSDPIPQSWEVYELAQRQLQIAHENGVLHGDVCFENMVWAHGRLYLYNFSYLQLDSHLDPKQAACMAQTDNMRLHREFDAAISGHLHPPSESDLVCQN